MTTTTTIASVLSAKALASADIFDVAGACLLLTADMMSALQNAKMPHDHEVMGMLSALNLRFRRITSNDGFTTYVQPTDDVETYTVKYNPDGAEIPAGWDDAQPVQPITPVVQPPANDITRLDNSILTEMASRKGMSGKAIRSFVVGAGLTESAGKEAIARLVDKGSIVIVGNQGRGFLYALPQQKETPTLTVAEMAVVSAAIIASYAADQANVDSLDAQSADGLETFFKKEEAKPKRKPGRPKVDKPVKKARKVKDAPLAVEPIADVPSGWGDDQPTTPTAPIPVQTGPDARTLENWTMADLLTELRNRADATTMAAHDHESADRAIRTLAGILKITL